MKAAGGDDPPAGGRDPDEQRGDAEDRQTDEEQRPPAEQVARAGAEEQQAAEDEGVGVLNPGERGRGQVAAAEPYSDNYDETVDRNVREQDADARPAIAEPLPDITGYDVVLLGSGLWNVRPPMVMRTFTEGLDFAGKTVPPCAARKSATRAMPSRPGCDRSPRCGDGQASGISRPKVSRVMSPGSGQRRTP